MLKSEIKNKELKINTDKELNKIEAKKYIKILSLFLKKLTKKEYNSLINAIFIIGMSGGNLNKERPSDTGFMLYENKEEVDTFLSSVEKTFSDVDIYKAIPSIIRCKESCVFTDPHDIEFKKTIVTLILTIHFFISNYLCGDIDSLFFINELL